mmetsp:Transcript_7179/g.23388  ORF Transcript_7179/g.23388 Transcript_7179/m.23388 type:complete len:221 (-) Transcript_7179:36-698(-)
MAWSWGENPMSTMRSASSMTKAKTLDASNPGVSSKWCKTRPGVATRRHILPTRSFSASMSLLPPVTKPAEISCFDPTTRKTSKVCRASSRVGEMMRTPRPSDPDHFSRYRSSSAGITKAKVFPDPVRAAPRTSRPARACGMAACWMGFIVSNFAELRPRIVRAEMGSEANFASDPGVGDHPRAGDSSLMRCSSWTISPSALGVASAGFLRRLLMGGIFSG